MIWKEREHFIIFEKGPKTAIFGRFRQFSENEADPQISLKKAIFDGFWPILDISFCQFTPKKQQNLRFVKNGDFWSILAHFGRKKVVRILAIFGRFWPKIHEKWPKKSGPTYFVFFEIF